MLVHSLFFVHPSHIDWFVLALTVLFLANLYILLAPITWFPWLWGVLQLTPTFNWMFKLGLLEMVLVYIFLSYFIEVCLIFY